MRQKFMTKCIKFCFLLENTTVLLQNAQTLLQNGTVIIKCDGTVPRTMPNRGKHGIIMFLS